MAICPSWGGIAPLSWLARQVEALQVSQIAQLGRDAPVSWLRTGRGSASWPDGPARAGWSRSDSWRPGRGPAGWPAGPARGGMLPAQLVGSQVSHSDWPAGPARMGCCQSDGWWQARGTAGWPDWPSWGGIAPLSWLAARLRVCRLASWPSSAAELPLSRLEGKKSWLTCPGAAWRR